MIEQHYSIAEFAKVLSVSYERVRQLVMNEPGVLQIPPVSARGKRTKRSKMMYRIPESVVQLILRRCANPPGITLPRDLSSSVPVRHVALPSPAVPTNPLRIGSGLLAEHEPTAYSVVQ